MMQTFFLQDVPVPRSELDGGVPDTDPLEGQLTLPLGFYPVSPPNGTGDSDFHPAENFEPDITDYFPDGIQKVPAVTGVPKAPDQENSK